MKGISGSLVAIDIETVTQGKRADEYTDNNTVVKTGNLKDPDKISAKRKDAIDKARSSHALHWWTGKVIVVGLCDVYGDREITLWGHDEIEILTNLADHLNDVTQLVSKSGRMFDYPFLVGRYMANGLNIPNVLKDRQRLLDCDDWFGIGSMAGQRGRLDDYAQGLGYDLKPMSGSKVGDLYNTMLIAMSMNDNDTANDCWKQLTDYCLHDTKVVRLMARLYYGVNNED